MTSVFKRLKIEIMANQKISKKRGFYLTRAGVWQPLVLHEKKIKDGTEYNFDASSLTDWEEVKAAIGLK